MDRVSRWAWGGVTSSLVVPVRETSSRCTPFAPVREGSAPPAVTVRPLQVKLKLYRREVERRTTAKHVGIAYSEDHRLPPAPPGTALPTPPAVLHDLRRKLQQHLTPSQPAGQGRPTSGSNSRSRPATASTATAGLSRHASRAKLAEHGQADASPERPSTAVAQGAADLRRLQRRRPEGHGVQPSETDLALRAWTGAARARFGQGSTDSCVAMRGCAKWLATSCSTQGGAFRELADLEAACLDLGIAKEQAMDVAARMWAGLASDGRIPVKALMRDLELPLQHAGLVVQKGTSVVSSTQLPDGTAAPAASGRGANCSTSTSAAIFGRSPAKPRPAKPVAGPAPEVTKAQAKPKGSRAKSAQSPDRSGSKSPRRTRSNAATPKSSKEVGASACRSMGDVLIERVDSQSEEPFFDETLDSEDEALERGEVASAVAGAVVATVCAGSRAIARALAASAAARWDVHLDDSPALVLEESPAPVLEESSASVPEESPASVPEELPASVPEESPALVPEESPASVLEAVAAASIEQDWCGETSQLVTAVCAHVVAMLEERDSAHCYVQSAVVLHALERVLAKQELPSMLPSPAGTIHTQAGPGSSSVVCCPAPVTLANDNAADVEVLSSPRVEPGLPGVGTDQADLDFDEQHRGASRCFTHSVLLRVARRKLETRVNPLEHDGVMLTKDEAAPSKSSGVDPPAPDTSCTRACPGGHPLVAVATVEDDYNCDACRALFPAGTLLWGCRSCNYDACQGCLDSPQKNNCSPPAEQASHDIPGFFVTSQRCVVLSGLDMSTKELGKGLGLGVSIQVLEVVTLAAEDRVRARIVLPQEYRQIDGVDFEEGWISLLRPSTGQRWAIMQAQVAVQHQPSQPPPVAKKRGTIFMATSRVSAMFSGIRKSRVAALPPEVDGGPAIS